MAAHRRSLIWKIDKEELKKVISSSNNYKQALNHFGLENKGENFRTLRKRMTEDDIDHSHFLKVGDTLKPFQEPIPLDLILKEGSNYSRTNLKKRLLAAGLLKNECYMCGQGPTWNNLPLSFTNGNFCRKI